MERNPLLLCHPPSSSRLFYYRPSDNFPDHQTESHSIPKDHVHQNRNHFHPFVRFTLWLREHLQFDADLDDEPIGMSARILFYSCHYNDESNQKKVCEAFASCLQSESATILPDERQDCLI
jgi:hypothetical protein